MNTDERILALVATGKFTLPKAAEFDHCGRLEWVPDGYNQFGTPYKGYWRIHYKGDAVPRAFVYDLCAMHFAQEVDVALCGVWPTVAGRKEWCGAMEIGNSAAAIKALYDAVIGDDQ